MIRSIAGKLKRKYKSALIWIGRKCLQTKAHILGYINRAKSLFSNPFYVFLNLSNKNKLNWMPDKLYLSIIWRLYFHKWLNWRNPQSFNEKIQWLKVYDHNPMYTMLTDKYAVRQYIIDTIGEQYLIPLAGGPWRSFEEIDFNSLPEQFVLKCTHDSGGLIVCPDKSKLDMNVAKKKLDWCLKRNYYWSGREWPYKDIPPRIIAEQYMQDASSPDLKDYKFLMYGSEYRCSFVCSNRFAGSELNVTFFDPDWNRLPFERKYHADPQELPRPENYEEMIRLSKRLSQGIPFARIDLYEINHKVYFGEITLYPGSGIEEFRPEEWDYRLGQWIKLPEKRRRK